MSLNIRHWLAERQIELGQQAGRLPSQAQFAGIAFRIIQDMEVKSLTPFDISTFAEVLELSLGAALLAIQPMQELSVWLLRVLSRKKPLKRNEGTWLTFQIAYLKALQGILEQETHLRRPWLHRAIDFAPLAASGERYAPGSPEDWEHKFPNLPKLEDQQLIALLKTLRPGRLSDSQAEQALSVVGDSFLVQQMNNTAVAWLIANGAEEIEAKLLIQRLVHGLPGYLLVVIAENALPLAQLQKFVRLANAVGVQGSAAEIHDYPLNQTREHYRAKLLQTLSEPLLAETFSLKDVYIPPKGIPIANDSGAASPVPGKPVDLMEWAIAQLEQTSIATIESDSGYGKTSFCQVLAAHVAQKLYPRWLPVLIRLRDAKLGQTLEQTLDTAFPLGRFTDRDGWLSSSSPPCLLILDGLEELPGSTQSGRQIKAFLDQMVQFHQRNAASFQGNPRHKLLLTATPSAIRQVEQNLTGEMQANPHASPLMRHPLARIEIQPMDHDGFRQWFQQWSTLQSKSIAQGYFSFLKDAGVFRTASQLRELAALIRQPMMLYLLGVLHRDGQLDQSILQVETRDVTSPQSLKFEIYDRVCRWLLACPTTDGAEHPHWVREGLAHACRSPEAIANLLQNRTPQVLRRQMQIAALMILQSGQHQVPQAIVQTRVGEAEGAPLRLESRGQGQDASPTLELPAFFFRSSNQRIEFSHPSLGEYLSGEEIAAQLKALTLQDNQVYGEVTFATHSFSDVARHIYTLLGYGLLSTELEDYIVERLRREEARSAHGFSLLVLFERLYRFYNAYCKGRWLDEGIAHQAHVQLAESSNSMNVLQVDAAVGLNVFLLLGAIAQVAQIPFWPCGNSKVAGFDADRLLTLIGRTTVLSPMAFWQRVCFAQPMEKAASLSQVQLAGACLDRAMLSYANCWQANLSFASLIGTNLSRANLQEANLAWANLTGADLSGANLYGVRLEGADLSGANLLQCRLTLANLTNACLYEAKLDEESKNMAAANGAIFSLKEFQSYVQSLKSSEDSELLSEQILITDTTISLIESAEGEPILPNSSQEWHPSHRPRLEYPTESRPVLSEESDTYANGETIQIENPPS